MFSRQVRCLTFFSALLLGFCSLATAQFGSADAEKIRLQPKEEEALNQLMNQIRLDKFNIVLPQIMRKHKIDMWIHVLRGSNPEFIRDDFGSHDGVFIFTDRGGDRIERAAFGQKISDRVRECGAYDFISEKKSLEEMPGSEETELDRRFIGVGEFVAERDPKTIGVNYLDKLGLPIGNQSPNQSDGISHTDFNLLVKVLGEKYAQRIVSAEYLIFDYLSFRVPSEFSIMKRIRAMCMEFLEKQFAKIVPDVTKRDELDGQASLLNRNRNRKRNRNRNDVFQRGDLLMLAYGREGYVYRPGWMYGNFYETDTIYAYLLRDGEIELPPELQKLWAQTIKIRKILEKNINVGRTGGETLEILKQKVAKDGFIYINTQDYDPDLDPGKTQVAIDLHAIGKGRNAPRISPLGPDWGREIPLPLYHQLALEYFIFMPMPQWGEGKFLFMPTHDGAMVTEQGIEYYSPPVEEIRIIQ
jgi:hypothetical protein